MEKTMVRKNLISLGIFLVFLVLAIGSSDLPSSSQPCRVQYKVTGTAKSVDITISTPGNGTEQRTVSVPYTSPTYVFKGWDSTYISAQNNGEYGSVTVEIISDGISKRRATSSGAYMIASVSWLAGDKK